MKKTFTLTLLALFLSIASFAQMPLGGATTGCVGGTLMAYEDSVYSGGTWTSSNPAVATVSGTAYYGYITCIAPGTAVITFTWSGGGTGPVSETITVNPAPAPISGASSLCSGTSITLTDAAAGGIWSTFSSIATVGGASGIVSGVSSGIAMVTYTIPDGCFATKYVTVNPAPTGVLGGVSILCVGSTGTIIDTAALGGVWTITPTTVATISSTGVVTGVSAGTATVSYTTTGTCGTATVTHTVVITSTITPDTITGPSAVTTGSTIYLSDATPSGTWSSSSTAVATVSSTGMVTGVSAGTVTISYTITGCSGPVSTTHTVVVSPLDAIAGDVLFGGSPYAGPVTVYLIKLNTVSLDLEAVDSMYAYSSGTSAHYQFTGMGTDSFRVKAAAGNDSSYVPSGYVPTYHTSAYYWHDADVIWHVGGTSDIGKDINMVAGASAPGPGFIGGDVTMGANRGTSPSIPAVGLLIFAVNSTTGQLVQQTYTDASGNYSFSGLPYGTYFVYPELINYGTIAYTNITLSASHATQTAANFVQHTVSHIITPSTVGVKNVTSSVSSVLAFPNPSNGKLNIQWNENTTENGTITVSDVTGRVVYTTAINMTKGTGVQQIDLSGLTNGLYLINIKSESISYNNKIQIQR